MGKIRQKNTSMTLYHNQLQQVMKVRLPYYGINKCKMKELFQTINWSSKSMIIKKERAC